MKKINENDINILDYIDCGSYGNIYKVIFNNKIYAFKRFKEYEYLKGKIRKINSLNKNIKENDLIIPDFFIVNDKNKIIGYLTSFFHSKNFVDAMPNKNLNEKILILKKLKNTILNMHSNKIIHADLIPGNILLVNDIGKIIDFDNCSYKKSRINIEQINDYSYDFIKNYGLSENIDIFLFNLMTFSIINDVNFYYVREKIYVEEFVQFSNNKDAIKICNSFFLNDRYQNKDFLIDTIDELKII